jgi:PIN domain nuclease of toxin-antitoxin system
VDNWCNRLSNPARSLIEDKANTILVSAVSFYELDNKMRLKKLGLKPQELRSAVTRSGLQTLSITDLLPNWPPLSIGITAILGTEFSPRRHV